jgi:glutamyl-tRNA reductase
VALSEIVLVGLNHKHAPVEVRERLAFSDEEKLPLLARLRDARGLGGAVLISTCNRVELYVDAPEGMEPGALAEELLRAKGLPAGKENLFYVHRQGEALRHLFRVACGLDSMVLGEPQILGQIKEAYFVARDGGVVSTALNLMFQKTFHVAKRVRSQTGIGERPVTVSYAAFSLACNIFESLEEKRVLLLGAGEMMRIVATHFVETGVGKVTVANRTFERAAEFARLFGAEALPWERFREALPASDIVIACTGAQRPILSMRDLERAMEARRWDPMFVIDMGVPRDVEPEASQLDGLYLYDIDDLQQVADEGLAERQRKAQIADNLIDEEVDLYGRFVAHQELSGAIAGVVAWAGAIQEAELEGALARLGALDERGREVVRNAVRRVVHKILHTPITEVKRLVIEEKDEEALPHFKRLFSAERAPKGRGAGLKEDP